MNTRIIGIVLIVIGLIMMAYTGFSYVTTENVVNLGPIQVNHQESHPIQWSPIIGVVLLVAGIVIIVFNKNGARTK